LPFGWQGVVNGAALIFFAYIGFDAVSTAAEETINPQRNLPIGIIGSLISCAIIFMLVTALLTGAAHYTTLNVGSPVADVLLNLGYRLGAGAVAIGAIAGLTTVILVMYYGFTRIFLAMARDGLLPQFMAVVNPKTQTPIKIIISVGIIMALVAGFVPIHHVAELVNIGTLAAFMIVCIGVIIMRFTRPDMPRPFKVPFGPIIPVLGALFCFYLMVNLPLFTWKVFALWTMIGLIIYFIYSRSHSVLNRQEGN
jgi:APA family basic amino acid/polyamine antiporter